MDLVSISLCAMYETCLAYFGLKIPDISVCSTLLFNLGAYGERCLHGLKFNLLPFMNLQQFLIVCSTVESGLVGFHILSR